MRVPYVIDNQVHKLGDVLNAILAAHAHHSLDIATAYFNIGGYRLLRDHPADVRSLRRLLGCEPDGGANVGLRPTAPLRLTQSVGLDRRALDVNRQAVRSGRCRLYGLTEEEIKMASLSTINAGEYKRGRRKVK